MTRTTTLIATEIRRATSAAAAGPSQGDSRPASDPARSIQAARRLSRSAAALGRARCATADRRDGALRGSVAGAGLTSSGAVLQQERSHRLRPDTLRAQDELDGLPHRAVTAAMLRDHVRDLLHFGRRVGHSDRQTGALERRHVEQGVADERELLSRELVLREQRLDRVALAPRAEDHLRAELRAARLRDDARFPGDHGKTEAGAPREIERDAVARVEGLQLV